MEMNIQTGRDNSKLKRNNAASVIFTILCISHFHIRVVSFVKLSDKTLVTIYSHSITSIYIQFLHNQTILNKGCGIKKNVLICFQKILGD